MLKSFKFMYFANADDGWLFYFYLLCIRRSRTSFDIKTKRWEVDFNPNKGRRVEEKETLFKKNKPRNIF